MCGIELALSQCKEVANKTGRLSDREAADSRRRTLVKRLALIRIPGPLLYDLALPRSIVAPASVEDQKYSLRFFDRSKVSKSTIC